MEEIKKFDIETTIYLRYQNKPKIGVLLRTINWIDPKKDLDNLFNKVLNFQSIDIGTFGLDLYGLLLNMNRNINIISQDYFGFQNSSLKPFNVAPYYRGVLDVSSIKTMSNDSYKKLLSALFLSALYDGSLYQLNKMLQIIFNYADKICVVRNGLNTIKIVSNFELEDWQKLFFEKNIIPIPIGFSYEYEVVTNKTVTLKKQQTRRRRKNETK